MKNRFFLILLAALSILIIGYFAFKDRDNPDNNSKQIINIGAVLPLTGDVASYGTDSKDGIDLAILLANKSQNKYEFVVNFQDSKGDPKTAVTAFQQIISTKNPIAVIGENISSSTGAMIPIAEKNKILLISPSASAPNLSGLSKYFFRVFPSDDEEGAFMSKIINEQHPNGNVAIIYVNNDYGLGLKNVFEKVSKTNSINVTVSQGFEPNTKDFKALLARIKEYEIDAIYIPSYYEGGASLVKQIREQGIRADIYGCTTHEDQKFLEIAGDAAEGFQYPVSTGYDENSQDKEVVNFIAEFEKLKGKKPGLVTALGYDSAKLIIDGILINGTNTNSIRDYLLNTKAIIGAAGIMNFDKEGNVHKEIILKKVINGSFK